MIANSLWSHSPQRSNARAVVERDGDCSVGVDGGVVDEGSPGLGGIGDCGVLAAVLVECGDGRALGFKFVQLPFEGLDCAEVDLVVGFEPSLLGLERARVEASVCCGLNELVDTACHAVTCGDRLCELVLKITRVTKLSESSLKYLWAWRWRELPYCLLKRGNYFIVCDVPGGAGGLICFVVSPVTSPHSWSGLVLWTGCFEGCWLLLVVLCPLACVLVG